MTPAEFVNYAIKKGCKVNQGGSENMIWLINPNRNGAYSYINNRHQMLYLITAQKYCVDLQIEVISKEEFLRYDE